MAWYFLNLNYQQRKAATRRPARVTDIDNLFRFKNYWLFKSTFPLFICYHSFFLCDLPHRIESHLLPFLTKLIFFFFVNQVCLKFQSSGQGGHRQKVILWVILQFQLSTFGVLLIFFPFCFEKKRPETNHFWLSISFHCFSPDFQILDVLATCSFFLFYTYLFFFFKRRSQVEISPPIFLFVTWQLNLHFCWGIF